MWGFSHKKVSMGVAIAPARPLLAPSLESGAALSCMEALAKMASHPEPPDTQGVVWTDLPEASTYVE
jgi:hypothetical protein